MGIKKVMEKKIIKWKLWGILIIALLMAGGAMMHITAVDGIITEMAGKSGENGFRTRTSGII